MTGPAPRLRSVDEIIDAVEALGQLPGDEAIPVRAHLLQTADLLGARHPGDPGLVAAGLVHDLGAALDPGCPDHAAAGAALVAPVLGHRVAGLVAGHAEAKRYLVTTEPAYAASLSPASTHSLVRQGGVMDAAEAAAFAARPDAGALLELRRADDAAKVPGRPVPGARHWRDVLEAAAALARSGG
ncbi:MAG TPA: hypothetical protein VMB72_06260 [Acidimicrobiales bacterium]|nr:hypothetical protein [Acidimicrobiales bacterium]